jgi:CRISPR-associated protein Csd1
LGLSPNSGRISIRFFLEKNFGEIVKNISKHYEDLKIIKPTFKKSEYIPLWQILNATVSSKSKDKSASPLMSGAVIRAIMTGENYPVSLFQNAILRVKSDYDSTEELLYIRVAIIKAYMTRNNGRKNLVELDKNLNEPAYILGRIFHVLESIQYFAMNENKIKKNLADKIEDTSNSANQGINVTIKEKYFTSACAMPSRIFPVLHDLAIHHLRKLNTGLKNYFENELTELMEKIYEYGKFPNTLTVEEQGMFILGYYHQRYIKTKKGEKENG